MMDTMALCTCRCISANTPPLPQSWLFQMTNRCGYPASADSRKKKHLTCLALALQHEQFAPSSMCRSTNTRVAAGRCARVSARFFTLHTYLVSLIIVFSGQTASFWLCQQLQHLAVAPGYV